MRGELVPLTVQQGAAEVEHVLRAASAPAHSRVVESHPDEVADGTFNRTRGDIEIVAAKHVVAHAMAMLAEVREDGEHLLALALVAGPGLRDGSVGGR